jgi:hypothetical protein
MWVARPLRRVIAAAHSFRLRPGSPVGAWPFCDRITCSIEACFGLRDGCAKALWSQASPKGLASLRTAPHGCSFPIPVNKYAGLGPLASFSRQRSNNLKPGAHRPAFFAFRLAAYDAASASPSRSAKHIPGKSRSIRLARFLTLLRRHLSNQSPKVGFENVPPDAGVELVPVRTRDKGTRHLGQVAPGTVARYEGGKL